MILGTSRVVSVYAYPAAVDLRKGYDGLYGLVQSGLGRDPLSGELYLFVNQARKLCKVLLWDGTGLCIFQKRLEQHTFAKLWRDDGHVVQLTASELALYIEGCTLVGKQTLSPIAVERKALVSGRAMGSIEIVAIDVEHEQDIEQLRRIAQVQQAQIQQLLDVIATKSREIERLRGKPGDLQLTLKLLEELKAKALTSAEAIKRAEAEQQRRAEERKKKQRTRTEFGPTPQPALPIVPRVFELDEPDRACTSCGGDLRPMKDQFEESELIDLIEVRYELVHVKQQKYVCRCGGCVETALGPERASPGSRYSLAFAIKVVLDKWLDHIPLERQCRILARHGLVVTSQTLWDLANALAHRLSRVDRALAQHVLERPVIGLDQTGWPRLESGGSKPWQMWCLTAPGVVVHRIRDDKSAATMTDLVGAYAGTIVCDALSTHGAGARASPNIVLAACWAHVFRRFQEALPDHPEAEQALHWIGALYKIDERAAGDESRRAELRRAEAPAVLDEFKAWLWNLVTLTSLSIGKAAAYTIANWDRLTRFVEDARIPLDNNATERAIRGPVVGRKNHYGSKSRRGTEVAATLYTVLETAKLHGIDPAAYLYAAITAADRGMALMPWDFAAAQPATAQPSANPAT